MAPATGPAAEREQPLTDTEKRLCQALGERLGELASPPGTARLDMIGLIPEYKETVLMIKIPAPHLTRICWWCLWLVLASYWPTSFWPRQPPGAPRPAVLMIKLVPLLVVSAGHLAGSQYFRHLAVLRGAGVFHRRRYRGLAVRRRTGIDQPGGADPAIILCEPDAYPGQPDLSPPICRPARSQPHP